MRVLRAVVAVVALIIIVLGVLPDILLIPFAILFGWIPAAKRLGGNLPFPLEALSLFFGGSVLFLLGIHWFLQQLKPWRLRWTLAISGGVALVLLAIMSVVGVAHQLGWILISREPVFARRDQWIRDQVDLMNTAVALADIARSNSVKASQSILYDGRLKEPKDVTPAWEKYNILFIEPTNGYFAVIRLRDQTLHRRIGAACISSNGSVKLIKETGL